MGWSIRRRKNQGENRGRVGTSVNPSLVGAKTVKSPSLLNVSVNPAALMAATSVERLGSAVAVSMIDFNCGDFSLFKYQCLNQYQIINYIVI